jgi:hypothetical protein
MPTCVLLILLAASALLVAAERFPSVEGETLAGQKISLPQAAAGQPAVVVIGFTQSSRNQTKAWADRVRSQLPTYSVAVLEDAPRLVRGMAVHGMKSGVPEDQRDHFVVIYQNEKELKQAAGFDAPNDAYVLLLDKNGVVRWHFHGPVTDTAIEELTSQAAK